MSDSHRLLMGTRKGLFRATIDADGCRFEEPVLRGLPVPYAVEDPRDGRVWASLDHGHWGATWSCLANSLPVVYSVRFVS